MPAGLDLEMLLGPDEDFSDPVKRQATAAALRRQYNMGTLGQLMGTQPTQQAGGAMQEQAQGSLRSALAKQQASKEAAARAAEQRQAQTRWEAEQKRMQQDADRRYALDVQQERRMAAAAGGDIWSSPIADPVNGGWIVVNKKDPTQFRRIDSQGGVVSNAGPVAGPPGSLDPLRGQAGGKPPPESQVKAGMQGGVSTDALRRANEISQRNPSAAKPGLFETGAAVFGLNPVTQQLATQLGGGTDRGIVRTATEGAIDAALTSMTGAAYTPEQLATYRARFMPTYLDNTESTRGKQKDFVTFIRQQSIAAGNAWTPQREANLQALAQEIIRVPGEQQAGPTAPQQPASGRNFEAEYGLGGK